MERKNVMLHFPALKRGWAGVSEVNGVLRNHYHPAGKC